MIFVKLYDMIHLLIFITKRLKYCRFFVMYTEVERLKHLLKFHRNITSFFLAFFMTIMSLTGVCLASETQTGDTTTYKFSDINLQVNIPNELICFTQAVTSNNAYLDLIGADDVEELRSLMKVNHIYLEAVPQNVSYELIVSGKNTSDSVKDFNTLSDAELSELFQDYLKASDDIQNESVTEKVTNSYIERQNDIPYFVTDVTSVANNEVTVYVRKYYTVMMGKAISFFIQSNGQELTEDMEQTLQKVVVSAEYKTIKKSIFENSFFSEILATVLTLAIPIALLALVVFISTRSTKKTKKQIAADEERLRAEYARQEQEKKEENKE